MEKAKAAVQSVLSKAGHHDTEVHERVAPAVQHETIKPHQREERQIATDREVHQDHYHTTVQPVKDREVLPEQHHHSMLPVEHRTHDKRDNTETEHHLRNTAAQFKDQTVRQDTAHTSTAAPTVAGEHIHHHIHETIQPVVQKETVEPHVTHTTVPVHEVHHEKAQHHAATALPAVSMSDFKKTGGALTGREERVDHFSGTPKNIGQSLSGGGASSIRDSGLSSGSHTGTHHGTSTSGSGLSSHHGAGATSSGLATGATGAAATTAHNNHGHDHRQGEHGEFSHRTAPSGSLGTSGATGVSGTSALGHNSSHDTGNHKPSMMDKLNPKKDADGDGKPGFMD